MVTLLALGAAATALNAAASTRPQIGGTLRVQISEHIAAIDPRQWPAAPAEAAAAERLDSLVFDRLVRLDEHGTLQPALAISWQHDAQSRRWQFRLRDGVKFSDGSPLTPPVAAMALQQLLGASFDVSATSDSVVIQAEHSLPDFPAELPRAAISFSMRQRIIPSQARDRFAWRSGPRREVPRKQFSSRMNPAGRGGPFVDKIELLMGVDIQQQANAISFGQADVVELPASQVRRAAQRGVRTVSSDPVELFALVFDVTRPAVQDARLRQAISLSIDRASIADVILQKQGVVGRRFAAQLDFGVRASISRFGRPAASEGFAGSFRARTFPFRAPCADLRFGRC